jgi:putative membrane protein
LHPLTPLLRGLRTFTVVVAAISLQGFAQLGLRRGGFAVLLAVLGALALSWVSWWFTGYQVVNRELRVYEGLVWRRSRAIALERLQSVEVVRPVMARLAGLAELRLEVVGAAKTEAPLAFLTVAQAYHLRDRLLRLSTGTGDDTVTAAVPPPVGWPAEQVLHRVAPKDLLGSQLLTPQAMLVPFALAASVFSFAVNPDLSLVGIIGAITATVGVALQPVRRVVADHGFTIASAASGLRLRHGLLETRSQTVPPGRVQALAVTWPLLWRPMSWLRIRIDVAGYTGDGEQSGGGTLLPVADPATAKQVIWQVLPGVDVASLPLVAVPRRARFRVPLRHRVFAAGLGDDVFAVRSGLLTRELVLVPYARIQSVRLVQGPWQRGLGLASVHADTAGGSIAAVAQHRDLPEARQLAAELTERARLARGAELLG